jgi:putative hydrolase of the HAD superfamily
MLTVSALVFDLDDTLFCEQEYVLSGLTAVGQYLEKEYKLPHFTDVATDLYHQGRRGNLFNLAFEILQFTYSFELIECLITVYRSHTPALSLFSDAAIVLEQYRKKYKMALLTDGYLIAQRNKVAALNIASYFDYIIYTDEYGRQCWKPSPFAYKKVADYFSLSPAQLIYISDNPNKDFIAPNQLGWHSVMVKREKGEYSHMTHIPLPQKAEFEISSLLELSNIIEN